MIIRNATPNDGHIVSGLIIEAIEDLSNIFTGYEDEKSVKDEMKNRFTEYNNRFSHEFCTVIEMDGQVAAYVISYPVLNMKNLNETIIKKLKKRFGTDDASFEVFSEKIRNSRKPLTMNTISTTWLLLKLTGERVYQSFSLMKQKRNA